MRLKHNKKRNTAFVYEALVRELTTSIIRKNRNKQNKIISIMKEHFVPGEVLSKELDLYKSIYQTKDVKKNTAEKIMLEAKHRYSILDRKQIFKKQSALINSINRTLSNKVYNNFVPNYKSIASAYSIFQDSLPIKDRVLLEEKIVDSMTSIQENSENILQDQKPIDTLVYNTFVNKFNEEYSDILLEDQKILLSKYISSFADNGLEIKSFMNEEIGNLKEKISKYKDDGLFSIDRSIKNKMEEVYNILESFRERKLDEKMMETVLMTQKLISEIEENVSND